MAKSLPDTAKKRIQEAVFAKADQYRYATRGRVENGHFMDDLVDDPEVGVVLREYMAPERIRTYIKDGILNAYTKQKTNRILRSHEPTEIVCRVFGVEQAFVLSQGDNLVCRSSDERVFIICRGTVLKWETALRKALEFIARTPSLRLEGKYPSICLQLAVINGDITEGDKAHISEALAAVGVRAYYCVA